MSEQRVRIVSTGPTWANAMVLVDGKPLRNVMSVDVSIRVDHMNTATIVLDGVEVDAEAALILPELAAVEALCDAEDARCAAFNAAQAERDRTEPHGGGRRHHRIAGLLTTDDIRAALAPPTPGSEPTMPDVSESESAAGEVGL